MTGESAQIVAGVKPEVERDLISERTREGLAKAQILGSCKNAELRRPSRTPRSVTASAGQHAHRLSIVRGFLTMRT